MDCDTNITYHSTCLCWHGNSVRCVSTKWAGVCSSSLRGPRNRDVIVGRRKAADNPPIIREWEQQGSAYQEKMIGSGEWLWYHEQNSTATSGGRERRLAREGKGMRQDDAIVTGERFAGTTLCWCNDSLIWAVGCTHVRRRYLLFLNKFYLHNILLRYIAIKTWNCTIFFCDKMFQILLRLPSQWKCR